eukprot:TRINITY_DN91107_c0_g1_i1.p1 TRINITY_DN91107_c0_g1~~TRINITY_DN91107_c0_g1_i1.p1  ORF type:complete len:192 (-),score=33.08 TRINITY_DN91107_c0_g1_i1:225-755(-)
MGRAPAPVSRKTCAGEHKGTIQERGIEAMRRAVAAAEERKNSKAVSSDPAEQLRKKFSMSSLKFRAALASNKLSNRLGAGPDGLSTARSDLEAPPQAAHAANRSLSSKSSGASKLSNRLGAGLDGLAPASLSLEGGPRLEPVVDWQVSRDEFVETSKSDSCVVAGTSGIDGNCNVP